MSFAGKNALPAAINVSRRVIRIGVVRLTPREIEILELKARGHSSKDAAEVLVVSKRTVDFHLSNIYDKLQVNNLVQALLAVTRLGLKPFEPSYNQELAEA